MNSGKFGYFSIYCSNSISIPFRAYIYAYTHTYTYIHARTLNIDNCLYCFGRQSSKQCLQCLLRAWQQNLQPTYYVWSVGWKTNTVLLPAACRSAVLLGLLRAKYLCRYSCYCVHDNKTSSPPTTCGLLGEELNQCFCLLRAEALFFLFPGLLRADTSFGSGSGLDPDSIRSVDPDPGAWKIQKMKKK